MNKEFIRLMIKAKKLEIQGLRELLPESTKESIDTFGKEIKEVIKESMIELYRGDTENNGDKAYEKEKRKAEKIKVL